jgi:DNA-binding MarR family transcriptional regulator
VTPSVAEPSLAEYRALAELRYRIRRFLRFSERAARAAGIEPQQHQLLLVLKGLPDGCRPTVGELAERLQLAPLRADDLVELARRRGLVVRHRDALDRRRVQIELTDEGEAVLRELASHHRDQLRTLGPELIATLSALEART